MGKYTEVNAAEWDKRVEAGNVWTLPVSHEEFGRAAAGGEWGVRLTPEKVVPGGWFPELKGARVLGLASGGGQQCPIFVARGARVTVFDISSKQLETELIMSGREGYDIDLVKGDMTQAFPFGDGVFDMVFNPVSNCYIHDVTHVWREAYRVLKPGGVLMVGFTNPCVYMFEDEEPLRVVNRLPYDPIGDGSGDVLGALAGGEAVEFSHSLTLQIGGQIGAGFRLTDMYEDSEPEKVLGGYFPLYIATRAVKPGGE